MKQSAGDKIGKLAERFVLREVPKEGGFVDRSAMWDFLFYFGLRVRRQTLREERKRQRGH